MITCSTIDAGISLHSYCWLRSCGSKPASFYTLLNGGVGKTMRVHPQHLPRFFNHNTSKIVGTGCKQICATCLPTVKPAGLYVFTLGSIMRLNAIMRMYSSAVVKLCTPRILASSVSTSWKGPWNKKQKPFCIFWFRLCTS